MNFAIFLITLLAAVTIASGSSMVNKQNDLEELNESERRPSQKEWTRGEKHSEVTDRMKDGRKKLNESVKVRGKLLEQGKEIDRLKDKERKGETLIGGKQPSVDGENESAEESLDSEEQSQSLDGSHENRDHEQLVGETQVNEQHSLGWIIKKQNIGRVGDKTRPSESKRVKEQPEELEDKAKDSSRSEEKSKIPSKQQDGKHKFDRREKGKMDRGSEQLDTSHPAYPDEGIEREEKSQVDVEKDKKSAEKDEMNKSRKYSKENSSNSGKEKSEKISEMSEDNEGEEPIRIPPELPESNLKKQNGSETTVGN